MSDFNFEAALTANQDARKAEVVEAVKQAFYTEGTALESIEKTTVYTLAEPLLIKDHLGGSDYIIFALRKKEWVFEGDSGVDVEGYGCDATAKGQPRKGAIKTWRYLPSDIADVVAF